MKVWPAKRVQGRLTLPGDKSISHRAAMIAALADGVTNISNFSTAQDCASTLSCLSQLGVAIQRHEHEVSITGRPTLLEPNAPLDCGNSGSTIRMLAGLLATEDLTAVLTGDESLSSRPMNRIIEPLELMGAKFEANNGRPPLKIEGTTTSTSITYKLPVASAQVKSAILFAALKTRGLTQVVETSLSRDHTERLFNGFGVSVTSEGLTVSLNGPQRFKAGPIRIPGDVSSAAYFVAAAMLLENSDLTISEVGLNPTRAKYLSVLSSWGGNIEVQNLPEEKNEPVGVVKVTGRTHTLPSPKARVLNRPIIPSVIDELPLLAVVGSQIPGGIEIRDAGELRLKESDRLQATAHNLKQMGASVEEFPDGMRVTGPTQLHGTEIDSFGDHRIAMAFSVAALIADGPSEIRGADCVNISFPEFFSLLDSILVR
jgi:3-phosphoshikimate 1-carboxyvinyltransferase